MLDFAVKYKDKLEELYLKNILGNDKYKFWSYRNYWNTKFIEFSDNEWDNMFRVSVIDDKINAFYKASIARPENYVACLSVLSMSENNGILLIKDLKQFVDELLNKQNFYKIKFWVVIGNPIEKVYDKVVEDYNGRIIGTFKKEVMLVDNKLYDVKYYEVYKK
jgi:hypothetical protein